mmetsp:Transcript_9847/g.17610  ORF Transcript_9847/g.17610 Transcript_9847/m.17610 type:complete len:84 (-) Transcript_9847:1890-2141(-)
MLWCAFGNTSPHELCFVRRVERYTTTNNNRKLYVVPPSMVKVSESSQSVNQDRLNFRVKAFFDWARALGRYLTVNFEIQTTTT